MIHALDRVQSPEEREYARYLLEIETRKRRIADLQAELASLKLALGRFEAEYHARVGVLFVELDRVRLAIDEYERRIAWLQTHPDADPNDIEDQIRADFQTRHEEIHNEEEETRRYERAFQRDQERPKLPPDAEQSIKHLYRDLAKRYHPDLARTAEERLHRETIMQRVNAAFAARDVDALRDLMREAEVADESFEARSMGEKLVWAIREVARLDEVIAGVEKELAAVRRSEIHQLWRRQEGGEPAVERLETDLRAELERLRERLAALIVTYRLLLDRRMG
ncbi:MAG TPA: J domain-containing protein [Thermomicrobiales bacterium]|nr:J domain-containing protein [Thermomicrobiales bacterium]